MRNENFRTDSSLNGNNIKRNNNSHSQSVTNQVLNRSSIVWIIAIGIVLLISSYPAFGQFTVQPMKLELAVTPGKIVKSALDIQSFDPNDHYNISLSVVELSQLEDGSWAIIEPNDLTDPNSPFYGFDISKLSSCKDWISLSTTNFDLLPYGRVPVEITLRVGRGVRGFYGAGIVASSGRIQGVGNVALVLRFLIPVIVEIQDHPIRARVRATDLGMEFVPQNGESPARSIASMSIENTGGTFSRVKPGVRIWSFTGGHWRVITTTELPETGIIPGAKLKLESTIRKRLPKGQYKLAGYLFVDGRRTPKIEKEMEFTGDPSVTHVGPDAPLDLDPVDVTIEGMPGATRTATLKVYNAADETVNIRTAMGLPGVLQRSTFDNVRGEDLDGTGWLQVTPEQFTLRGHGGHQTLRIVSVMPDTSLSYPCYFSLLALWASYPDGQQAGYATSNICLRNGSIDARLTAVADKLTAQDLGDSKYLVVARFGNVGLNPFVPIKVKTGLTMSNGVHRVSTYMMGDPSMMLPFEQREYSGVLDLSYVPADLYRLTAAIEYAPGLWADKQIAVQVSIEGERRVLKITQVEEELSELIEVKWQ